MPDQETTPEVSEDTSAAETAASVGSKEAGSSDTGTEQASKQTTGKENLIPQSRFNEVVAERNSFKEELEGLRNQVESLGESNQTLAKLLNDQKEDVTLVANLRQLASTSEDQKVKDAIDLLDARLRGDEEAVEEAVQEKVESGALTEAQARKIVREQTTKLQDSIDEQKAELLFNQANLKAERMLSGLPEEYTDKDREIISREWIRRVDWDGIEGDPGRMDDILAESLDELLNWYGEPRGAVKVPETGEAGETEPVEKPPTPLEVLERIKATEWGGMKDGKPIHSDEEFDKAVAQAMRVAKEA